MAVRALHHQRPTEPPRSYSDHGIVAAERNGEVKSHDIYNVSYFTLSSFVILVNHYLQTAREA